MFDLFAWLMLLVSMLAPIGLETGWAPGAPAAEESSAVTALDDGNMPPPGRR
jgi:hypothetical protein